MLDDLLSGAVTDADIEVSIDRVVPDADKSFDRTLETELDAVELAWGNIDTSSVTWNTSDEESTTGTARFAWFNDIEGFVHRGLELIGELPAETLVPDDATFALTTLNAIIDSVELAFLIDNNGSTFDALETALNGLLSYVTLDVVNQDDNTKDMIRIGESSLRVYEQDSPDMSGVTSSRSYRDDLWSQTDVDLGNLWIEQRDITSSSPAFVNTRYSYGFGDQLFVEYDADGDGVPDYPDALTTDGNTDPTLVKIDATVPGGSNISIGEGTDTSSLAANDVEMLKEYVQRLGALNESYYTNSYYTVDINGDKALSAVAILRVNGTVAHQEQLESGIYLTADNWEAYADAAGQSALGDLEFSDANVQQLIVTAFNQNLRTDVKAPVEDGTRVRLDGADRIGYFDVQTFKDSDGFFLPATITLREEFVEQVNVESSYVVEKENAYEVTYDSMTLSEAGEELNYGFWYGTVENVILELNATNGVYTDIVNLADNRYVENLTIRTGEGIDVFTLDTTGANGTLTIESGDGADVFNVVVNDGTGDIVLDSGLGADRITFRSNGPVAPMESLGIGTVTIETNDGADLLSADVGGDVNGLVISADNGIGDFDITTGGEVTSPGGNQHAIDIDLGDSAVDATIRLGGMVEGLRLTSTGTADDTTGLDLQSLTTADITSPGGLEQALDIDLADGRAIVNVVIDGDVEGAEVRTGSSADEVQLEFLGNITAASEQSALDVDTGEGQDELNVTLRGHIDLAELSGGDNADVYSLDISTSATGDILIDDELATDADSAGNVLTINTTDEDDFFLFRNDLIFRYDVNQRIDYRGFTGLSVFTHGGNDSFIFDDSNVLITVDAGAGDDSFQLGQMYQSPRDNFAGLNEEDEFSTILTTKGYLSNGVSAAATLIGGDGDDSFTVLSNQASINLEGGADNDSFLVRSFVLVDPNDPLAPITNINGGTGADNITYAVNAIVRISGGDGLDSLTVVGTEFADDYVITDDGVYGAGRFTAYEGIEQIVVDGLEGNDEFYVFSTPVNAELKLIGGLGSDIFNVGDGPDGDAVEVVADDLEGHNSLIEHTAGDVTRTLSVKVMDEDEAGVRIIPLSDGNTLFEDTTDDDGLGQTFNTYASIKYAVVLTRPPKGVVSFSALPAIASEEDEEGQGNNGLVYPQNIQLNGSDKGITFLFDKSNWFKERTVTITAPVDSDAFNGGIEGLQSYQIQHSIVEDNVVDGDEYDTVEVNNFAVNVVDSQTPQVVVLKPHEQLIVGELSDTQDNYADGFDTYELMLSKEPTQDVTINLQPFVDPETGAELTTEPTSITFINSAGDDAAANVYYWNSPAAVKISAIDDSRIEGIHYSRILHEVVTTDTEYADVSVDQVDVMIGDNEVQDIIFLESHNETIVTEEAQEVIYVEGQSLDTITTVDSEFLEFYGTFGLPVIAENGTNNSFRNAQNLDDSEWGIEQDADIDNVSATLLPHISVSGELEGTADFYSFDVTEDMLDDTSNSVTIKLDIDGGYNDGDDIVWRSELKLYQDTSDNQIAEQTDAEDTTARETGQSASSGSESFYFDDYLTYEITEAGTYVVEVTNKNDFFTSESEGQKFGIPDGVTYELHVSVEAHERNAWAFLPDTLLENEEENSTLFGTNIDDSGTDGATSGDNWYNFANPNIGDEVPAGGLEIDSSTPYTTISGAGDGSVDRFNFHVSTEMLQAASSGFDESESVESSTTWLSSATFLMSGVTIDGQSLSTTLIINEPNQDAHTTLTISDYSIDTAESFAQNLADAITAAAPADTIAAAVSGSNITIAAASDVAFYFANTPEVTVAQPTENLTARTLLIDNQDGSGDILFADATLTFNNTDLEVDDTWFLQIGGTTVSHTVTDASDSLGTLFHDPLLGLTGSGDTLSYSGAATSISVWVEHTAASHNLANLPSATLTGTPAEIGEGQLMEVDFGSATVNYFGEEWTLTITDDGGSTVFDETVTTSGSRNTRAAIQSEFESRLDTFGHSTSINGSKLEITVGSGEGFSYDLQVDYANVTVPTVSDATAVLITKPASAPIGSRWSFTDGINRFTFTVSDAGGAIDDFAESFRAAYASQGSLPGNPVVDGTNVLINTGAAASNYTLQSATSISTLSDASQVGSSAVITLPTASNGDFVEVSLTVDTVPGGTTFTFDGSTWTSSDADYAMANDGTVTTSIGGAIDLDVTSADYFAVSSQSFSNSTEFVPATIEHPTGTIVEDSTIDVTVDSTPVTFTFSGASWTSSNANYALSDTGSEFEVIDANTPTNPISLSAASFDPAYTETLNVTDATESGQPADVDYQTATLQTGDAVVINLTSDSTTLDVVFTFNGTDWDDVGNYSLTDSGNDYEISLSGGSFTINDAYFDDASAVESGLTTADNGNFNVADLTGLSPATSDRVEVTFDAGATSGVEVTFTYDGSAWISSDSQYELTVAGRLQRTSGLTNITITAASEQSHSSRTVTNEDHYGSATIAYPSGFSSATTGDTLSLSINSGTEIEFGIRWCRLGNCRRIFAN